jgi:hypothetical protein
MSRVRETQNAWYHHALGLTTGGCDSRYKVSHGGIVSSDSLVEKFVRFIKSLRIIKSIFFSLRVDIGIIFDPGIVRGGQF